MFKPGFLALNPGAFFVLRLNTTVAEGRAAFVAVDYLTSYQHMGTFRMSCVRICECEERTVDAHTINGMSIFQNEMLPVSSADGCDVRFEVLSDTSSGEHKVKIATVAVDSLPSDLSKGALHGWLPYNLT